MSEDYKDSSGHLSCYYRADARLPLAHQRPRGTALHRPFIVSGSYAGDVESSATDEPAGQKTVS